MSEPIGGFPEGMSSDRYYELKRIAMARKADRRKKRWSIFKKVEEHRV